MEKILPQDVCLNINRLFICLSANKCVELSSNKTMNPNMCPIFVYGEKKHLINVPIYCFNDGLIAAI